MACVILRVICVPLHTKRCWCHAKLQTCWISCIVFLAWRDYPSCSCSSAPQPFFTLVLSCIGRKQELWPLGQLQQVPGVVKEERGCPTDNLLSRAQSLKWCCWEALVTRSPIPQAPSSHHLMHLGVHIAQQEDVGEKLERGEFTACGKVFRCTGLESCFVKSLCWGKRC